MKINRIILLILLSSCIEKFDPKIDAFSNDLVINGLITNESPARVSLESTVGLDEDRRDIQPVSGATITLYDDQGNQEILSETALGVYTGSTVGQVGVSYHIEIDLEGYDKMISAEQTLKSGPEVGDLFVERAERYEIDEDGFNTAIYGLNLNMLLNSTSTNTRYFRWTLNGTYKAISPLDTGLPPCYVDEVIGSFFVIGESQSSSGDLISNTLRFIESNRRFVYGYSALVTQYSLNEESYDFWKKIDDQQKNVGSVFDSPPAQILGNMTFVNNPENPVLGFFEASSVQTKRIFIYPTDFLFTPVLNVVQCFPAQPTLDPPPWCFNCLSIENSTNTKPSYWPE